MSQTHNVVFGALAVAVSLGAAEYASGHDLAGSLQVLTGHFQGGVNRAAKGDRAATIPIPAGRTRTIQLRFEALPDTSVLARVPAVHEARNGARTSPPLLMEKPAKKPAVACEPVVSTLTEIARLLQPGRCVT